MRVTGGGRGSGSSCNGVVPLLVVIAFVAIFMALLIPDPLDEQRH